MAGNGEWKTVRLSEVYDFSSGLSKPRSEFGFGNGFLSFKDVLDNFFVPDTLSALVNSTEKERERCSVKRGDVFLTRTSETQEDLGMSCVALKDYELATFNGFTKRLRPKPDTNIVPEYAAYYFRGPKFRREVTAMSSLSTRASLNNGMLDTLSIVLPPAEVQSAIGRVLKALDAKIELNRRMNETLESLARSLFKSWFVDFDPVRAKMDGRPPPGLSPATAALFPDKLEHQNGELIPTGWSIEPVGEVVQSVGGGTPSTKDPKFWEGGTHHWATPKDLSGLPSPILLGTNRQITDAGVAKISSGRLPAGTLLLSSRAPVGYLAIAQRPVAVNQGFIAMVCNERASNYYMLQWCHHNMGQIEGRASGTTFQEISKKNFRPIPMLLPPVELVAAFTERVSPVYERMVSNLRESETLAALRDTLLPRLLSGELRVADAEQFVSNATEDAYQSDAPSPGNDSLNPESRPHALAPMKAPSRRSGSVPATIKDDGHAGPATDNRNAPADLDFTPVTRQHMSDFDTDDVMAAIRQTLRGRGTLTRDELLKGVSVRLGFERLGSTIREVLKGHLRAAIRRKVVGTDGPDHVFAVTAVMADYTRDELIQFLCSVIGRGGSVEREDAIYAVAWHLGFRRVSNTVIDEIKSAINGAIRRGILGYEGDQLWRQD